MKALDKLYQKNEVAFALIWIAAYVLIASYADAISLNLGIQKCVTAPVLLLLSILLWAWVGHAGLKGKFGLRVPLAPAKRMLLYLPLVIIVSRKLWFGATLNYPAWEAVLFIVSMLCVGFLEEMVFRGLLFRGMAKSNLTAAIIVSAITFGLGHIVNLFNASGQDLVTTIMQIVFAVLIGFMLVFVLLKSGSIWPCIIFHGVINSLSAFENEAAELAILGSEFNVMLLVLGVTLVVGGGYLLYLMKQPTVED